MNYKYGNFLRLLFGVAVLAFALPFTAEAMTMHNNPSMETAHEKMHHPVNGKISEIPMTGIHMSHHSGGNHKCKHLLGVCLCPVHNGVTPMEHCALKNCPNSEGPSASLNGLNFYDFLPANINYPKNIEYINSFYQLRQKTLKGFFHTPYRPPII